MKTKTNIYILCLLLAAAMTVRASQPTNPDPHPHPAPKLPPLHLTAKQEHLLASVSSSPRTALDYYMLLPKSCFDIMPDSPGRRISYITANTLTDDFLDAIQSLDCDRGGFHVTLKLYRTATRTFIVINQYNEEVILKRKQPIGGEPSIGITPPSLWLYAGGTWIPQSKKPIPRISRQRVLHKYHHDWDADKEMTDQEKYIWLDYNLSPTTDDIVLMGRENFQTSVYEYARLRWRNGRFVFK